MCQILISSNNISFSIIKTCLNAIKIHRIERQTFIIYIHLSIDPSAHVYCVQTI